MSGGSITFLGTGTAFHDDGRGSQSLYVRPPRGAPFLVDVAPTAMAAATRFGVDCSLLDRLFLTHLHGDHIAGWPFLFLHLVFVHDRTRPFEVFGPEGTRETLQGLLALCYPELVERARFEVRYVEMRAGAGFVLTGDEPMRLNTVPVRHHSSSRGLKFHLEGVGRDAAFAVSGDTGWCPELVWLAEDVDALILECTSVHPGIAGHLSLAEVRQHAGSLSCRRIVLVHMPDEVARQLALDPIPRVLAAHDGLELALSG